MSAGIVRLPAAPCDPARPWRALEPPSRRAARRVRRQFRRWV